MIKTILKWMLIIGFVLSSLFVVYKIYPTLKTERRAGELLSICRTIPLDMNVDEVIKIMDAPIHIDTNQIPGNEYYYFLSPKLLSEPITVVIKDKMVIGTRCGEGYGVYKPRNDK